MAKAVGPSEIDPPGPGPMYVLNAHIIGPGGRSILTIMSIVPGLQSLLEPNIIFLRTSSRASPRVLKNVTTHNRTILRN